MKILYSCLSKSWGGMEMITLTSIKQLLERGVKVEFLCVAESRLHIEANNMGLIIHPVKSSGYFRPFSTLKLMSVIRRGQYDLIHTQFSKDLWLIIPALKLLSKKIPVILTKQMGSYIVKNDFLHRWIYEGVTLTFAISRVIKKNLLETVPLPEEKIIIVPNAVDIDRFDPSKTDRSKVRNEFDIKENEILIGMLARFSPGKGHEEFLTASKRLNEKFNNLRFMVVGEASRGEDEYAKNIKRMAEELSPGNIIFTGYRSDTPEVLAAMDIFVFPSHAEAFGIALAEAMAMGKASAASDSDGVLDIMVDRETGYLFRNKNAEDLYEKVSLLIENPENRQNFGRAARKRAVENFDINIITDKVISVYNNICRKC